MSGRPTSTSTLEAGTVLATAGHVDHGKSTLVQALTGTDPDRLAEEKARGLTIDLGFASTTLPSGLRVSFVDVPGHIRFIKNMLAGAGAVQACLLVVAATEGWKAQSEEHLRILELLGLERGLVVLSMADRVEPPIRDRRRAEVRDRVEESFLAGAPVLAVDSVSGSGLGDLLGAIDEVAQRGGPAADRGRPRLWIDRSFPVAGAGSVVTGTLAGGSLSVGGSLTTVPGDHVGRVRGLQSHGRDYAAVGPGNRVAVNLAGVTHGDLRRGQALVGPGDWWPTDRFDALVSVLASLDHSVSRRGAYRIHVGSAESPVRLRLLGRDELPAGAEGPTRLFLPSPLALMPGDRFVLRESGRGETVGGGAVLDIDPVVPAARAQPDGSVDRVVEERGWTDATLLVRLTAQHREPDVGHWVVSGRARRKAEEDLYALVDRAGADGLDPARLDERQRALLPLIAELQVGDGRVRRAGGGPPPSPAAESWLRSLSASPFEPPPPEGVDRIRLRQWLREGVVVEAEGLYFSSSAVAEAARTVARLLAEGDGAVTASAVRVALGTSRKFALPLLGHLDRTGVTRRRGELRVAGPRLPSSG